MSDATIVLLVLQACFVTLLWILTRRITSSERRRGSQPELLEKWERLGQPTLQDFLRYLEDHEQALERACSQVWDLVNKVEGPKVACSRCQHTYRAIFADTKQGSNCAATVYEKDGRFYIQGHYGSTVCDLMKLEWITGKGPEETEALAAFLAPRPCDPICDPCIATLALHDRIRIVGDTNLYGEVQA